MKRLIALRIDQKEDAKIEALSKKSGLSYSEQIRRIIRYYFEYIRKPKTK